MAFIVFVIAWLGFLVLVISTRAEPEKHPLTLALGWLCLLVIFGCALYTMAMGRFWSGVAMIGSLSLFIVKKEKDGQ